jgi:hypothetical protein
MLAAGPNSTRDNAAEQQRPWGFGCAREPQFRRRPPRVHGRWAILREQPPRDAKEHQGRAQAFERKGDYSGGGDPQAKADHERCPV